MGKASKWFRSLLGLKRPDSSSTFAATSSNLKPPKDKRRWSFVKSYRESTSAKSGAGGHSVPPSGHVVDGVYPDKHAIAVAAATAAVAEAAVAAAQAASAVVKLTSSSTRCIGNREEWAVIKIQSAFRGCLARRALRALKGLVKLQALVRGHIERKRTAEWLHRMQVIVRAQSRVRAGRAQILHSSISNSKSSNAHFHGPATPEKFESPIRSRSMKLDQWSSLKRNGSKSHVQIYGNQEKCLNRSDNYRSDEQSWNHSRSSNRTSSTMDEEKSVKILEIDSGKPHFKRRSLFHSSNHPLAGDNYSQSLSTTRDSRTHHSGQSTSSCEVQSYKLDEVVESPFDSTQLLSAYYSRECVPKSSPFTPTRSDDSRSYVSGCSENPSYMAYTESSKAKVRSLSAPKQRPQYERSSSSSRYFVQGGFGDSRLMTTQKVTTLHAGFTSKAYPGSGRLDKFGMPVGYRY